MTDNHQIMDDYHIAAAERGCAKGAVEPDTDVWRRTCLGCTCAIADSPNDLGPRDPHCPTHGGPSRSHEAFR